MEKGGKYQKKEMKEDCNRAYWENYQRRVRKGKGREEEIREAKRTEMGETAIYQTERGPKHYQ